MHCICNAVCWNTNGKKIKNLTHFELGCNQDAEITLDEPDGAPVFKE